MDRPVLTASRSWLIRQALKAFDDAKLPPPESFR